MTFMTGRGACDGFCSVTAVQLLGRLRFQYFTNHGSIPLQYLSVLGSRAAAAAAEVLGYPSLAAIFQLHPSSSFTLVAYYFVKRRRFPASMIDDQ